MENCIDRDLRVPDLPPHRTRECAWQHRRRAHAHPRIHCQPADPQGHVRHVPLTPRSLKENDQMTTFSHSQYGSLPTEIHPDGQALGAAAARTAGAVINDAIARKGTARVLLATGNSQLAFLTALRGMTDVAWDKVELFHLDEYIGISSDHPASFRKYLHEHFVDHVSPWRSMRYGAMPLTPKRNVNATLPCFRKAARTCPASASARTDTSPSTTRLSLCSTTRSSSRSSNLTRSVAGNRWAKGTSRRWLRSRPMPSPWRYRRCWQQPPARWWFPQP